jgi:hypothetical protein
MKTVAFYVIFPISKMKNSKLINLFMRQYDYFCFVKENLIKFSQHTTLNIHMIINTVIIEFKLKNKRHQRVDRVDLLRNINCQANYIHILFFNNNSK